MELPFTEQYITKERDGEWIQRHDIYSSWKDQLYVQRYANGVLEEPMRVLNRKYWPFQFVITNHDIYDIERWCYENLKSRNWRNYGRMIAFKTSADATLYSLRWA